MFSKQDQIQGYDDELLAAMNAEDVRQEHHIDVLVHDHASRVVIAELGVEPEAQRYEKRYGLG